MKTINHGPFNEWKSQARPTTWEDEELFFEGDAYFADLLAGIAKAHQSVRLETYIFGPGQLGERLTLALIAAARRSVRVQVLIDGVGSPTFMDLYGQRMISSGIQVRLFRSWPWQRSWFHNTKASILYAFFNRWININRGNHRKFCLVDDSVAWVGGFNIQDEYLVEFAGTKRWADVGIRIRGEELHRLTRAFRAAFQNDLLQKPMQGKHNLLLLNSSYILRKTMEHQQLSRLKNAKSRIWIQTPYFVPIAPIYWALRRLGQKGGDVKIIVPLSSDVPLIKHLSYAFFHGLLKAGVRIFEYEPTFAHQKILQVDDWATVGSTNLNHRSFLHDLEIDVVVTWPANRELIETRFNAALEKSKEVTLATLRKLSWWKKAIGWILLRLRYWS
jgi:cardiolipin synthase A/B